MNVLSLFDGMSCGQIALERAGIPVTNYYASEIDKWAIKVTQHNYPNTLQIGDVTKVKAANLQKIDLLIGGSPCQGFSFAGKGLNFEDPRSKLFFEYVRLLKECTPKYFLLENVKMKKEYQDVISEYLGVEPIPICSSLVSAQMRKRLYWTNIPNTCIPERKEVIIKDILQDGCEEILRWQNKTAGIVAERLKSASLRASGGTDIRKRMYVRQLNESKECAGSQPSIQNRVYDVNYKSPALVSGMSGRIYKIKDVDNVRSLTEVEAERLQTVPDNYTSCVSSTQRYKMLGNGWTVDVIAHIFKVLKTV